MEATNPSKASSLRWSILRNTVLRRSFQIYGENLQMEIERISRKSRQGFNLIPFEMPSGCHGGGSHTLSKFNQGFRVCYTLPIHGFPKIILNQREEKMTNLRDFEICNQHDIDNTGLICSWPSEDVLSYFSLSNAEMFRSKRVIELGSGYGLAGLVIAVATEAAEVIVSDGNPQVVDYIQHNIENNSKLFGQTSVKCLNLHWNCEGPCELHGTFDIIVASDCTFFEESHEGLVRTIKVMLSNEKSSEALLFCPRRGFSLNRFLKKVEDNGLYYTVTENYDAEVWRRHLRFSEGDESWPNYEKGHSYPLLTRISKRTFVS